VRQTSSLVNEGFISLSTLFRNVPIVNLLEMSPFAVDVEQNIAVALYEQG
jgi:hypothetical protein